MIHITDAAKAQMISVLMEENAPMIRFGLKGGGCNGFSYFFLVESTMNEDDVEFPLDSNYKLVVDASSNMYLEGAEIDYKKDLMGENFVFNNPNSTGSCGCGSSVSF